MTTSRRTASWTTDSPDATRKLARALGETARGGMVIGLVGILGAGKTHFVKGLAAGIGCTDEHAVTSPTFVIVNEYRGRLTLYHLDAYRLHSASELEDIGFAELIRPDSLVVVEWADRVGEIVPDGALWVTIDIISATGRSFAAKAQGMPGTQGLLDWAAHLR